jgi:hypothetical protein
MQEVHHRIRHLHTAGRQNALCLSTTHLVVHTYRKSQHRLVLYSFLA